MGADAEPVLHRPFGAGHPYRVDPDQRHPVVPVLGEPLELRVLVGAGVDAVWAELEPSGISVPLMAVGADELYPAAETAEGHLAAASGARPDLGGRTIWRAVIEAVDAVGMDRLRYRFRWRSHWTGGTTEWFEAWPGSWAASSGGELVVDDQRRVVDGSVEWLVTARGPVRMRFAMHLGPGEHVCGFGERFDAVDQRGRRLDTTVSTVQAAGNPDLPAVSVCHRRWGRRLGVPHPYVATLLVRRRCGRRRPPRRRRGAVTHRTRGASRGRGCGVRRQPRRGPRRPPRRDRTPGGTAGVGVPSVDERQ